MKDLSVFPSADFYAIAPGRVNLLGEHVDYNDGLVLPIAIDRSIFMAVKKRPDRLVQISALDINESIEFDLDHLADHQAADGQKLPLWSMYPAGVAASLQEKQFPLAGMDAAFTSNIPVGAGLSSSAALEMAFAVAWQALAGQNLDLLDLAKVCRKAEVDYVGLNCGLMDQFASACGVEGHALLLDTRSLDWRTIPLPERTAIVIADSTIRRSLVSSGYNDRHRACEQAMQILQKSIPEAKALRDISISQFEFLAHLLPEEVRKRARHVVEECARVDQAITFLEAGDAKAFGDLMIAGHASLRDLYEVSLPELDCLVELAISQSGCLGARLTGAGFGGCTVNLVKNDAVEEFIAALQTGYQKQTGKIANIFQCKASRGAYVTSSLEGIPQLA